MWGCSSLTLSILTACVSMVRQQHMMTMPYCPSIQERSSFCVCRQSKYSRIVHVTSIRCRLSNTRCMLPGSAIHLQSQSGSKWKSFEMPYQKLEVQTTTLPVVEPTKFGVFESMFYCSKPGELIPWRG